jgi:hypothetical protein
MKTVIRALTEIAHDPSGWYETTKAKATTLPQSPLEQRHSQYETRFVRLGTMAAEKEDWLRSQIQSKLSRKLSQVKLATLAKLSD